MPSFVAAPRWGRISFRVGAAPARKARWIRWIMTDNKKKKATDRRQIDLNQPYELGYWSRKFGVPEQELADAVHTVGSNAEYVAIELGRP